jgi:hypothetical protein
MEHLWVLRSHRDEFVLVDSMSSREIYESLMDIVRELLISPFGGQKSCGVVPMCYKKLCCSLSTDDVLLCLQCEQDDDSAFSDDSEDDKQPGVDGF